MLIVINDMFYFYRIIQIGIFIPIGFFIFIFFQAYLLSRRFSKAFKANEKLSAEMNDLNMNLEIKVQERTEELQAVMEEIHATMDELGGANEDLSKRNKDLEIAEELSNKLIKTLLGKNDEMEVMEEISHDLNERLIKD